MAVSVLSPTARTLLELRTQLELGPAIFFFESCLMKGSVTQKRKKERKKKGKDIERDTEISSIHRFTLQIIAMARAWLFQSQQLEFSPSCRDPSIFYCFSRHINTELYQKWSSQDSNQYPHGMPPLQAASFPTESQLWPLKMRFSVKKELRP